MASKDLNSDPLDCMASVLSTEVSCSLFFLWSLMSFVECSVLCASGMANFEVFATENNVGWSLSLCMQARVSWLWLYCLLYRDRNYRCPGRCSRVLQQLSVWLAFDSKEQKQTEHQCMVPPSVTVFVQIQGDWPNDSLQLWYKPSHWTCSALDSSSLVLKAWLFHIPPAARVCSLPSVGFSSFLPSSLDCPAFLYFASPLFLSWRLSFDHWFFSG